MFRIFKGIAVVVYAIAVNSALADQLAQSAMNQNGSAEVMARLRYSWKNVGATQIAAPTQKPLLARNSGKTRSRFLQAKRATGR